MGLLPAHAIAQSAITCVACRGPAVPSNKACEAAPVSTAATPAARAARRLSHVAIPDVKTTTEKASASRGTAARRAVDGLVGTIAPRTVPRPRAERKYAGQMLEAA